VNIFEEPITPGMNDAFTSWDFSGNEDVDLTPRTLRSPSEEAVFPSYFACLSSILRSIFTGLCGVRRVCRVIFFHRFPHFTAFVAIV
jgi:hypothetical protein